MTERAIMKAVALADLIICGAVRRVAIIALAALVAAGAALIMGGDGSMRWDRMTKIAAAAAGAVVGWLGGWNRMLTILVAAMSVDYVTGLIVAACGRSPNTGAGGLSSRVGFVGLAKKAVIMLVVLLATLLDRAVGNAAMVFQSAAACYYIANEGLSILENAGALGVPFPERVKAALETMKEEKKA